MSSVNADQPAQRICLVEFLTSWSK